MEYSEISFFIGKQTLVGVCPRGLMINISWSCKIFFINNIKEKKNLTQELEIKQMCTCDKFLEAQKRHFLFSAGQ